MKATAAVVREGGQPFSIETIDIAEPRSDEVRVRIAAVGICHSDLNFASGEMGTPMPMVLGHEGAGTVESIGADVTKVAVGDKVLLTFDSCGQCSSCTTDHPSYCRDFNLLNLSGYRRDGSSPLSQDGTEIAGHFFNQSSFSNYAIAGERNLVRLSPDADLTVLAPFGCGIQTGAGAVLRSLQIEPGSTMVVLGGGAVGLSAVMAGVIAECATIIVVEPHAGRRGLALTIGAHHAIDPIGTNVAEEVQANVPGGAKYVIDTSGNLRAINDSIGMLAPLGTLGLIGVPSPVDSNLPVSIVEAMTLGITVRGILVGDSLPDVFLPELIELYEEGRFPVNRMITSYRFDEINNAVADIRDGNCVKAVLIIDEEYDNNAGPSAFR
jgi:aryl-alcohol dehydrogenase